VDHFHDLSLSFADKSVHLFFELRLIDVNIVAFQGKIPFLDNIDSLFFVQRVFSLIECVGVIISHDRLDFDLFDVVSNMRVHEFIALYYVLYLVSKSSSSRISTCRVGVGVSGDIHFEFLLAAIIVSDGLDGLLRRKVGRIDILRVSRPLDIASSLDPAGAYAVHISRI
jgi:hypothetical protein